MKTTIEPGGLAAAVKFAARSLTARGAYPILGGLKITATPGGAEVCAFDGDTSARARLDADTGEPGTVLAPGRLLAHICGQLPKQATELATTDDGLTLACGSTRYTLRLLPARDYPALPELGDPAGQADGGDLAAAIGQVTVAASRDDTLPVLCAVQVSFAGEAVTLAATDRYRAASRQLPWQPASGPLPPPVLIPAATLTEVARAADSPVTVHVLTGDDSAPAGAGFAAGDRTITTRLASGQYPDLDHLIPTEFAATALAGTEELAAAIRRLAVVAARDTPVHLAFGPGQIELTAGSPDEADATDTIPVDLDGDPLTVAFHPRRLLDALTATGTGRVRIALTGPTRPALFTPADGDDDSQDDGPLPPYWHLLVPIRPAA
jgi:DNA polymerase-3 subunit beta